MKTHQDSLKKLIQARAAAAVINQTVKGTESQSLSQKDYKNI